MDCKTVRSLLVPYLDGELAPAQVAWIDAHREICDDCSAAVALLSSQGEALAALPPPPLPGNLAEDMWGRMDDALARELDAFEARAPAPQPAIAPPPPRNVRLSRTAIYAYAALLGLAVAFGLWRHEAAASAEARVQALSVELERAERLKASPKPLPQRSSSFTTAAYTRGRGHL